MKKLTQERLKELLNYDPEAGVFVWLKTTSNRVKVGRVAGNINKTTRYRYLRIDRKLYSASSLAFLYMEGYFPEHEVDHRNRNMSDDRWENLRHVSRQCNMRNKSVYKANKSGITGIFWNKRRQRWTAQIGISDKKVHLGTFKSIIDAAKVRWNAEVKYGFPDCNTTSSAYLYLQQKGAI